MADYYRQIKHSKRLKNYATVQNASFFPVLFINLTFYNIIDFEILHITVNIMYFFQYYESFIQILGL